MSDQRYHIRRENMLRALGLPERIPVGTTRTYENVAVTTGTWDEAWGAAPEHVYRGTLVLPRVHLVARGVANRIQVECPECGKRVRFSVLQQHVGTGSCKKS